MILLLLLIGSCAGFTYLLTILTNNITLIPVWILSSIFITVLVFAFLIYCVLVPIFKKLSPTNRLKHAVARQFTVLIGISFRTTYKIEDKKKLLKITKDPVVFVANHKTALDAPWVYSMLNRPVTAVAKDSLKKVIVFKPIMEAFHIVAIDRTNDRNAAKSIIQGVKQIKDGLPMVVFPEGSRLDPSINQMVGVRPGAYKLATKSEATIQPLAIKNAPKLFKRLPFAWTRVTIKVLDPIPFEFYKDMNTTEIALEVAKRINATFDEEPVEVKVL